MNSRRLRIERKVGSTSISGYDEELDEKKKKKHSNRFSRKRFIGVPFFFFVSRTLGFFSNNILIQVILSYLVLNTQAMRVLPTQVTVIST